MAEQDPSIVKSVVAMNIPVDVESRGQIDIAAKLLRQSRTRFVVDAAVLRAENVILDRRAFALDDTAFDALAKALAEPRTDDTEQRLHELVARPKRWS